MRSLPWFRVSVFGLTLLGVAGLARPAAAVFTVDIVQQPGKVVATGSGTIDLTALTDCCGSNPPQISTRNSADSRWARTV